MNDQSHIDIYTNLIFVKRSVAARVSNSLHWRMAATFLKENVVVGDVGLIFLQNWRRRPVFGNKVLFR